jgi:predicted nucleic acid-binding protein
MGYVLDTSALMRLLLDEPGADEVEQIVEGDEPVALPFMALMEVQYVLLRRLAPLQVDQLVTTLRAWPVEIVESDQEWGRLAAQVKARGGLSLGDAWMASLALRRDASLIHQDPEFDGVPGLRAHRLGPAPARAR